MTSPISHYQIVKKLGAGGMGEVYLAEDTRLNRKVAIKILPAKLTSNDQARRRLLREARAAATLDHPNICAIHEVGEDAGKSFIIMQYIEGETLASRIQKETLDLRQAVEIAIQIADALSEAHSRGVIHRDIKPQNVMVNTREQAKVLDFGLAKIVTSGELIDTDIDTVSTLTGEGVIMGTAAYMSPEQVRNAKVDARCDVFSLGATVYESVTRCRPFSGPTMMEISAKVLHFDPPAPSKLDGRIPLELDRIVLKALSKNAEARYQKAEDMRADLIAVRDLLDGEARNDTQPAVPRVNTSKISALRTMLTSTRHSASRFRGLITASIVVALAIWLIARLLPLIIYSPYKPLAEAQKWYEYGMNALHDGAYDTARKRFERVIEVDPLFVLGHVRLAEGWLELDHLDNAQNELVYVNSLIKDVKLTQADQLYIQAINHTVTRNFAKAIEIYTEVLNNSLESSKIDSYFDLGRAYERNEQWKEAREVFAEVLRRDSKHAAAFLRQGVILTKIFDPDADKSLKEAETLYRDLGNIEGQVLALYQQALLYTQMGAFDEAKRKSLMALGIANTTDLKLQQVKAILQLSQIASLEGNSTLSKQNASEAMGLARKEGLENHTIQGILDIGNSYVIKGETALAKAYFLQALELAQLHKSRKNEARARLSLAALLTHEAPEESQSYAQQALMFYEKGGYKRQLSQSLAIIGHSDRLLGNYEVALDTMKQQLNAAHLSEDRIMEAYALEGMAHILADQQDYPSALNYFDQSFVLNKALGLKVNIGFTLKNKANMLWRLGDYSKAESALKEATDIAKPSDHNYKELISNIHLVSAHIAFSKRDFKTAQIQSYLAMKFAGEDQKDIFVQAQYTLGLAKVFSKSHSDGLKLCQQAFKSASSIKNTWLASDAQLALAYATLECSRYQEALLQVESFIRNMSLANQQDSRWIVYLIAARACKGTDKESDWRFYAVKAKDSYESLHEKWINEGERNYFERPDIKEAYKQLLALLYSN